jgi:PA domain
VRRGTCGIETKTANVAAAGALGIVVYNNQSGVWNALGGFIASVPAVLVLQADGLALRAALRSGQRVLVTFSAHAQALSATRCSWTIGDSWSSLACRTGRPVLIGSRGSASRAPALIQ